MSIILLLLMKTVVLLIFGHFSASSYKVLYAKSESITSSANVVTATLMEVNIVNLEQQSDYNFWVVPVADGKDGSQSTKQTVRTKALEAPDVTVGAVQSTEFELFWNSVIGFVWCILIV